ncbi:MAG TPA: DUF2505 family protein [Terriglobales bacterium]|nr:DUF2505 family protein [Terriglobales bacterium]
MRFTKTSRVSHPASLVLDLMIHRMHDIVPFLPNVESIELRSKEDLDDGKIRIVRYWQGTADNLPSALRPFISKDVLGWTDTALWEPAEYKVDWTLSTNVAAQLYECSGTNHFEPDPKDPEHTTRIRITGNLQVHPDQLPGVPRFLGSRLAPQIEKFVVDMLTPNLTDVAKGLQNYFDAQARANRID